MSGKDILDYNGTVNTLAPQGKAGTLLLDPTDIEIVTSVDPATTDMTGTSPFSDATNNGGTSRMSVGALETALAGGNVTVTTQTASGSAPKGGTITIDDGGGGGVQWGTTSMLKLQADNQILINSHVQGPNGMLWLDAVNGAALKPGTLLGANTLLATGGGNWDLAGVGNTGFVNSYSDVNTLAANITGGGVFRFGNNKNLTIGTVNGVSGITHTNGDTRIYLDRHSDALQLSQNITSRRLIMRAAGGITQPGGRIQTNELALTGGAVTLTQSGNQVGTLAASLNGAISVEWKNKCPIRVRCGKQGEDDDRRNQKEKQEGE